MKTWSKKLAVLSLVVVGVLGFSLSAFANSANYNDNLPAAGGHDTICSTTKGSSTAKYVNNNCTYFDGRNSGWSWSFWVDATGYGQVCPTTVIGSFQNYKIAYSTIPPAGTAVQGRGSTNGLLSSPMNVKGSVDFDVN